MTLDPDQLMGTTIGPYTLDRLIGQGGFAWVFAGQKDGEAPVALKVLKPRYAGDAAFDTRFRNEAQVASELRHPNAVRIQDVGHAGEITYFAMDLYPDSLATLLERNGPLSETVLLRVAMDVANALAFAHDRGFIHRDLKIDNIFLRPDGASVLADFGIARAVTRYVSATGVNMTIGTPHYISPEQAQGRALDGRSDLYALGVTLYKAATGDLPFRSSDWFELARMHVEDTPSAPRKRRPDLSKRFERVILKCLAKHPDDRYASAAALLTELQEIPDPSRVTESFGVGARPTTVASGITAAERQERWILLALAVLVVVLVAATVVILGKR